MSRKEINKYFFAPIFSLVIIFSPINFSFLFAISSAQVVPNETISDSVVWSEDKTVTGILIINSGATLTIKKGVVIDFDGQARIDVRGKLIIDGTPQQPVVLRKKDADIDD